MQTLSQRAKDFLKGTRLELVSSEAAAARMAVCEPCPSFVALTKQCSQCGCLMEVKTYLLKAVCPLGKW